MDKFFNPKSIVIFGLSEKKDNIPGYILKNTLRWGYKGKIFGVTPGITTDSIGGVSVFQTIQELPVVPDLAVMLIPAKFVATAMEECGKFGINRVAVLAGGFNESGESGNTRAEEIVKIADRYNIRFMGPNGLTVANAHSGICLPFLPHKKMKKGGFSLISQSGGLFFILWNLMNDHNLGMAKFASIGNKLNIDEADLLEYLGNDPETEVIGLYLENVKDGKRLLNVAEKINKPIIALKSNRSKAGARAAMSHTASMSNNDEIIDSAFEKAGIIRVEHIHDLISVVKAFGLPPMRGNRVMVMTPGGGSAVMMADLCEKNGFEFSDLGKEFYDKLKGYTNAGDIINFSNPLDMGDIYNITVYPKIFHAVLNNENVDAVIYGHARPLFPEKETSIFKKMFHTDISKEITGAMLSAGKPVAVSFSASAPTLFKIRQSIDYPIYERAEAVIVALRKQSDFYARQAKKKDVGIIDVNNFDREVVSSSIKNFEGNIGEEFLDTISTIGIQVPLSKVAKTEEEAIKSAKSIGYPVVLKVVSKEILHKSDAGGVITGIANEEELRQSYKKINSDVHKFKRNATIEGIRVSQMAEPGVDMFVGAMRDESFGPVVVFGYGGIYTEIFKDINRVLCPASFAEIKDKLKKLKCYEILQGARGNFKYDIERFVDVVKRVADLMEMFPEIIELDLNPVRVFKDGAIALDARAAIRIKDESKSVDSERVGVATVS